MQDSRGIQFFELCAPGALHRGWIERRGRQRHVRFTKRQNSFLPVTPLDHQRVLAGLQHHLGIPVESTASVGNSEIDVGLFRRSRVGVAFRPEDAAVRAAATAVVTEPDLTKVLDALARFPTS